MSQGCGYPANFVALHLSLVHYTVWRKGGERQQNKCDHCNRCSGVQFSVLAAAILVMVTDATKVQIATRILLLSANVRRGAFEQFYSSSSPSAAAAVETFNRQKGEGTPARYVRGGRKGGEAGERGERGKKPSAKFGINFPE